ncbi:MAG: GNAT family N-acetyltransferase, partial [Reichenbachiella sp.]
MSRVLIKRIESDKEIESTAELAELIWNEHYPPIIGQEQVDYMLHKFQSRDAISSQINNGIQYFFVSVASGIVGYLSFELKTDCLFLSKVYLQSNMRGTGIGREILDFVFETAKSEGRMLVRLTVNKQNENSIKAYEKIGFERVDEVVMD